MPSKQAGDRKKSVRAPGVERRRQLRQQRRREHLIHGWRILFFAGISAGLGWLLLSKGWLLTHRDQIQVRGSANLSHDAVLKAGEINIPLPLLGLKPSQLEQTLLLKLPVQSVVVNRRLLPPALQVSLTDREPIAYAVRQDSNLREKGMVDALGHWMPLNVANQGERPRSAIEVQGWRASHRLLISRVLEQRDQLGSPLLKIIVAPDGELSLQTKALGLIQLGMNPDQLDEQLKTITHLTSTIPPEYRNRQGTSIDLSDPGKPELQVPQPSKRPAKTK